MTMWFNIPLSSSITFFYWLAFTLVPLRRAAKEMPGTIVQVRHCSINTATNSLPSANFSQKQQKFRGGPSYPPYSGQSNPCDSRKLRTKWTIKKSRRYVSSINLPNENISVPSNQEVRNKKFKIMQESLCLRQPFQLFNWFNKNYYQPFIKWYQKLPLNNNLFKTKFNILLFLPYNPASLHLVFLLFSKTTS